MTDFIMGLVIFLVLASLTYLTAQREHPVGLVWVMAGVTLLQAFSLAREVRLGRNR